MFEKLPEACASGIFLRRKREMAPMGNAAAFPEHLAEGNSTAQVHWCTARSPDVSLRGAKRRGNLAVLGRIIGYFRRKRNCLPEIATGAKRPRNDKSLAFTVLSAVCTGRQHRCRERHAAPLQCVAGNFPLSVFNFQLPVTPAGCRRCSTRPSSRDRARPSRRTGLHSPSAGRQRYSAGPRA